MSDYLKKALDVALDLAVVTNPILGPPVVGYKVMKWGIDSLRSKPASTSAR